MSLATDNKVADKVNADMKQIATAISENRELDAMLQSPVVRSSDKVAVLKAVFGNTNEATSNLIDTLITNKRIAYLLGNVANKYNQLYDALRETQIAKVTTATPLTKELREKSFI